METTFRQYRLVSNIKEVQEMAVIDVNGDIISNEDKWFYDWFDWEGTVRMM